MYRTVIRLGMPPHTNHLHTLNQLAAALMERWPKEQVRVMTNKNGSPNLHNGRHAVVVEKENATLHDQLIDEVIQVCRICSCAAYRITTKRVAERKTPPCPHAGLAKYVVAGIPEYVMEQMAKRQSEDSPDFPWPNERWRGVESGMSKLQSLYVNPDGSPKCAPCLAEFLQEAQKAIDRYKYGVGHTQDQHEGVRS